MLFWQSFALSYSVCPLEHTYPVSSLQTARGSSETALAGAGEGHEGGKRTAYIPGVLVCWGCSNNVPRWGQGVWDKRSTRSQSWGLEVWDPGVPNHLTADTWPWCCQLGWGSVPSGHISLILIIPGGTEEDLGTGSQPVFLQCHQLETWWLSLPGQSTKVPQPRSKRNWFSHSSGGWKSEIKVLSGLVLKPLGL